VVWAWEEGQQQLGSPPLTPVGRGWGVEAGGQLALQGSQAARVPHAWQRDRGVPGGKKGWSATGRSTQTDPQCLPIK